MIVKIVASAVTIGSGGREGPTAQISAGFGSLMARVLDLSPEDGRIAVSVGIGSGIGAIFSAPLGGAVLAADIVYRDDFEFQALLPGTFASIIAYAILGRSSVTTHCSPSRVAITCTPSSSPGSPSSASWQAG